MEIWLKSFSTSSLLTFLFKRVKHLVLQINTLVVPKKGVLPTAKKGILTLTLVMSRESARPAVTRGLCVMNLKFFKIKTKIQLQVEAYIAWKKSKGVTVSDTIIDFIKYARKENIESINPRNIQNYYLSIKDVVEGKYFLQQAMKDIRVMFRWFKARKFHVIDPNIIGDKGLTFELEDDILDSIMEEKPRIGRPPKVALINKVKSLRNINKLSFREIARVIRKDVSQVHVWYYYNLQHDTK